MGNQQTALSGIHPFRDPNDPVTEYSAPPVPPPRLIGFNPVVAQAVVQPEVEQEQQPKPFSEFDELFVLKPPTPPPRRNSSELPSRRRSLKGLFGGRNLSLKNLRFSRPDLNKLGTLLRWKKKKKIGEVYPVPPDAEKPSPPSKPEVIQEEDYFLVRWDRPGYDGGLPIIGYIIQHLELGLPQPDPDVEKDDTQSWYSSEPGQVTSTEVMLNNLIPGTTYIFRIIAENLLGYSQPGETSTPIVFNPHGELDDWFCPPVFVIPLDESYTVLEHERVCLSVEITGQPYPLVKFVDKNDLELKRDLDPLKYTITSCGQKRTLIISSVEVRDSGVIRVVGENEKGVVECSGVLVVEAPPRIRRIQKTDLVKEGLSEEDQKLVGDEGVIFQSGELAKFKFIWSASPYPNVCVYHDGDLVDGEEVGSGRMKSQRVGVEVTDNMIVIKIPNVQRSDRGEWTVRLDNVLGEDSVSLMLTVTDKPSRPGKPDVLQLSDNTVILKWAEPYDDGGVSTQGYIVEYYRSEWGVWLKACTTKNPYTKIRDLIPGSKYKFRVKAENLYGVSTASDESVELLITDLVSTLRSVGGEEATLLMKTVLEEEEEDAVRIEEEDPGKPTPPKRKLDRGGSNVSLNKVSFGTMTEVGGLKSEKLMAAASASLEPSSPKLLRVSLQPQVIVLDEPEETLQPPEIQPRNRSPSPMNRNVILEESEPNSREKSPDLPPRSRSPVPPLKVAEQLSISSPPRSPIIVKPIAQDNSKKLYSRAEIIRSAATEDLDYYLNLSTTEPDQTEEIEEDPELLKVKEALMNDEEEEELDEYEYDFDQLQQEYEEDKKRGMVSRQDSGVSGRSVEEPQMSRGESFAEEEENARAESVPVEISMDDNNKLFRRGSFERAQSEVVGSRRDGGSGTFLHDRFTDYIAMKASNRNQRVGSSLRSLNSGSRYSSNEQLVQQAAPPQRDQSSKDSGRSSVESSNVTGELKPFRVRSFNVEDELEGLEKLERSVSKASFRGTYDVISPQGGGRACFDQWRGVSAPDLGEDDNSYKGGRRAGCWGSRTLEHSRSEQFHGVVVPDSGLQARGMMEGGFMPGGVDSTSGADDDYSREEELDIDLSLERDVPRERCFERRNIVRGDSSASELLSVDEEMQEEEALMEFEDEERKVEEAMVEEEERSEPDETGMLEEEMEVHEEMEPTEEYSEEADHAERMSEISLEDLKFKTLETMREFEFPEKSCVDGLLSKLDKLLSEEVEEEKVQVEEKVKEQELLKETDGLEPEIEEHQTTEILQTEIENLQEKLLSENEEEDQVQSDDKVVPKPQEVEQPKAERAEEPGDLEVEEDQTTEKEEKLLTETPIEIENLKENLLNEEEYVVHDKVWPKPEQIEQAERAEEPGEPEVEEDQTTEKELVPVELVAEEAIVGLVEPERAFGFGQCVVEDEADLPTTEQTVEVEGLEEQQLIGERIGESLQPNVENEMHPKESEGEICEEVLKDTETEDIDEAIERNETSLDEIGEGADSLETHHQEVSEEKVSVSSKETEIKLVSVESPVESTKRKEIQQGVSIVEEPTEIITEAASANNEPPATKQNKPTLPPTNIPTQFPTSEDQLIIDDSNNTTDIVHEIMQLEFISKPKKPDLKKDRVPLSPPHIPHRVPLTLHQSTQKTRLQATRPTTLSTSSLSSIDSALSPVPEEQQQVSPQPKLSRAYAPDMSAYDRLSRSRSSLRSSTRESTPLLLSHQKSATPAASLLTLSPASQSPLISPDTPVTLSEIHKRLEESRNQLIQSLIDDQVKQEDPKPVSRAEQTTTPSISPFMTYLFNAAFYLMLSPMLLFVDSLYTALLCLVLIACVHFWLLY